MAEMDWLKMLSYQQALHRFSRALLHESRKCTLTASELEILSILYLHPEQSTPLALSRQSGMKKEAVSRCLKQLFEKDCLRKKRHPADERSYMLSLTETGSKKLHENYAAILQPIYDLHRRMGAEFETLFGLIEAADRKMKEPPKENGLD